MHRIRYAWSTPGNPYIQVVMSETAYKSLESALQHLDEAAKDSGIAHRVDSYNLVTVDHRRGHMMIMKIVEDKR